MDPILKLEVDAFLHDIWLGTPIELALAKADLVLVRKRDEEITEAAVDHAIAHALGIVLDTARSESSPMKTGWESEKIEAIAVSDLERIVDEWNEGED